MHGLCSLGLLPACGDDPVSCTAELRTAVSVEITGADLALVERVTAQRTAENDCERFERRTEFDCGEQGGGEYTVRVYVKGRVLIQKVNVAADECHTTEYETVTFDLDAL